MPNPLWLTAWVKVNAKHVAYPENHLHHHHQQHPLDAVGGAKERKTAAGDSPSLHHTAGSTIGNSTLDTRAAATAGAAASAACAAGGATTIPAEEDLLSSSQRSRFRRISRRRQSKSSSLGRSSFSEALSKSGKSQVSDTTRTGGPDSPDRGDVLALLSATVASPAAVVKHHASASSSFAAATTIADGATAVELPSRRSLANQSTAESRSNGLLQGRSIATTAGAAAPSSITSTLNPAERLLAGIFGRHPHSSSSSSRKDAAVRPPLSPKYPLGKNPSSSLPVTGKYLNEAAFIQQLEQRLQFDSKTTDEDIPRSVTVPPVRRLDAASQQLYYAPMPPRPTSESLPAGATGNTMVSGPPPPLNILVQNLRSSLPHHFFAGDAPSVAENDPECLNCSLQEDQLQAALDDLAYMRSVALKLEQQLQQQHSKEQPNVTVSSSQLQLPQEGKAADSDKNRSNSSNNKANANPWPSSTSRTLADASKQLNEVTHRQKKQIEQLTKERCRWQHDTHFKLHKFANLCKDLNEESATRNEEALALRKEMRAVKDERDEMAEEVVRLRAQVKDCEQRERQNSIALVQRLEECEKARQKSLDDLEQRDRMISELSLKLVTVLDQLEQERAQPRQRRQIIFPTTTTK